MEGKAVKGIWSAGAVVMGLWCACHFLLLLAYASVATSAIHETVVSIIALIVTLSLFATIFFVGKSKEITTVTNGA
jgi:hypothetical protein